MLNMLSKINKKDYKTKTAKVPRLSFDLPIYTVTETGKININMVEYVQYTEYEMSRKQNSLMRFSKNERLAQLSEQEIVIERKKKEIQAKLEAQKKKQTEEALKNIESVKEFKAGQESYKKPCSSGDLKNDQGKINLFPKKELLANAFSNDGSFLDQFKKLSNTGFSLQNTVASTYKRKDQNKEKKEQETGITKKIIESSQKGTYEYFREELLTECKAPISNTTQDCTLTSEVCISQNDISSKEGSPKQNKLFERRKRKSRWGDAEPSSSSCNSKSEPSISLQPPNKLPAPSTPLLSQLTRSDPGLIQYAKQTFGSTNLSEEDWKKAEDHYKINLLYQDMVKKRAEVEKMERAGKFKYEYDSDEDTEGGTWEHKLRQQEMMATQLWAEELTRQAAGKHHIGDFLPPEELERFMEKYNAVKEGREPDLSDYKEYKLKEDNVGYRLLQKMGWNEGEGLGQNGSGITNPVNKATTRHENQGLGIERPDGLGPGDDEYDAYRKRMMLAYRFRPNPLNNPRRPYY